MNKKSIKIVAIIVIAVCLIVAAVSSVILIKGNKNFELKEKYEFIDTSFEGLELSDKEKENITLLLKDKYVVDGDLAGFGSDNSQLDWYYLSSLVQLSKTLGMEEEIGGLANDFKEITGIKTDSMNILRLIYYVTVCEITGVEYDEEEVNKCLDKYYDKDMKLFFLTTSADTINTKLLVTKLCCDAMPELVNRDDFAIVEGVNAAFKDYKFATDTKTATLFSSGGDILDCMNAIGILEDEIISEKKAWFESWQKYYSEYKITTMETALTYLEFYKIAKLFDSDFSNEKLQEYYNKLDTKAMAEITDFNMINNLLEYVDADKNEAVKEYILNSAKTAVEKEDIFKRPIYIQDTVYGVILAKYVDFDIDKAKLQNYIDKSYDSIEGMSVADKISQLYYTLILEQQINDTISWDAKKIQKTIDAAIKSLEFGEEAPSDITVARKSIEIIMDLQLEGVDVNLKKHQADKLIKGLEDVSKRELLLSSVLITDLYILNEALGCDIIDKDLFVEKCEMLMSEGGNRSLLLSEEGADIYSTKQFNTCLERMGEKKYVEQHKSFVEKIKAKDGIYEYAIDDEYSDLMSVLYGNIMK